MYDCVTVLARTRAGGPKQGWRTIVSMNKIEGGHIVHESRSTHSAEGLNWLEVLLSDNIRAAVVEPIEQATSWTSPKTTPATSAASIGVRLLARFAERVALSPDRWFLRNGYFDTSGYEGGVEEELFAQLPLADTDRRRRRPDDLSDTPEYRYWFLVHTRPSSAGVARLAVDTMEGIAFTASDTVDLMHSYNKHGRSLDALVSRVCPPAF